VAKKSLASLSCGRSSIHRDYPQLQLRVGVRGWPERG
jgi:hypothetical protein